MRSLRLATQLLTRLPVRRIEDFSPLELSRSTLWFPLVGLGIGIATLLPAAIAAQHPLHAGWIVAWMILLLAASVLLAPLLCLAPLAIAGCGYWLKKRVGGMTGDCLGAGIEVCETVLIVMLVLAGA